MKTVEKFTLQKFKTLQKTTWANPKILEGYIEISIVDEKTPDNNYPILMNNNKKYSINGKSRDGNRLMIMYNKKSPIVDGRLVCNYTFALRFKHFLEGIDVCDPCSEEELEMLKHVAEELLDYQVSTANDCVEVDYLKRNGVWKNKN